MIENSDFIESLYAGILGRPSDEGGRRLFVDRLSTEGAVGVINEFLESKEGRDRSLSRMLVGELESKRNTETQLISLGTHCYTSFFLKKVGLKKKSTPFDWIFSSPLMIVDCLKDDFSQFLNRDHYQVRDADPHSPVQHLYYREKFGIDSMFNHHRVDLDHDYAYMVRCVERFRALAKSQEEKLFILFRRFDGNLNSDFEVLADSLQAYASNFKFVYISVSPHDDNMFPRVTLEKKTHNLALYRLHCVGEWHDLYFDDVVNEIAITRILQSL